MSQIHKVTIPVQMGSRKIQIIHQYTFNDYSLNIQQLMKLVLKKLFPNNERLDELVKTYRLYENALGVERIVKENENILNLYANQTELKSNVYFIMRKKSLKINANCHKKIDAKKCFEKFKIQKEIHANLKVVDDNEKINQMKLDLHQIDKNAVKEAFMSRIFQNEIILKEQIQRIDCLDQIIEQNKDNKFKTNNFFQSFYSKLKHQKKSKRNNFNQSSMILIDSAGESSSASSTPSSSSSKLDTLF